MDTWVYGRKVWIEDRQGVWMDGWMDGWNEKVRRAVGREGGREEW